MQQVGHYDTGLWKHRIDTTRARILTLYIPFALIILALLATIIALFIHRDGQFVTAGLTTGLLAVTVALILNWISPYVVSEVGRLTYDRVRTTSFTLPPRTPKAMGLMGLLLGDLIFQPMMLFAHRSVVPGTAMEQIGRYLLLQPTPDISSSWSYPAAFWIAVIWALLTCHVGLCCIVPTFAYPGMGGSAWKRRRAMVAYAGLTFPCLIVLYQFLGSIPCTESGERMFASHFPCLGHGHIVYLCLSLLCLIVFGLPMLSGVQQMMILDNSTDAFELNTVRTDPVALGTATLARACTVVCCATEVSSRSMIGFVMFTHLLNFLNVVFLRFSSVKLLNSLARLTGLLNVWASFCVAIIMIAVELQLDQTTSRYVVVANSVAVPVVVSLWFVVFALVLLGWAAFQWRKNHGKFFLDSDNMEAELEDIAAEVYLD